MRNTKTSLKVLKKKEESQITLNFSCVTNITGTDTGTGTFLVLYFYFVLTSLEFHMRLSFAFHIQPLIRNRRWRVKQILSLKQPPQVDTGTLPRITEQSSHCRALYSCLPSHNHRPYAGVQVFNTEDVTHRHRCVCVRASENISVLVFSCKRVNCQNESSSHTYSKLIIQDQIDTVCGADIDSNRSYLLVYRYWCNMVVYFLFTYYLCI